ncbi:MAG: acetylornithine deacetylase [Gammaproteobacteria bacterium]|nr:acetylornithine deacetylase [Gammaproteobacteria bacterium]
MEKLPEIINAISQLIAAPSISSVNPSWDQSNQSVIERLHGWFSGLGFAVETFEVPDHPGKFNLVATAGKGADGLVLSGHTDTVPFDENRWSQSPFKLTEKDQRLYGLGSCDMKGFFAFIMEAVRDLDLKKLKHPLIIIATADEESSMCGAKALKAKYQRLGRHCVIGEPTELKPIRMHKGILMEGIRLTGQSGHSSDPSLGNNALEGMHTVISDILAWRDELQQRYQNPAFKIAVPTLNLGHIHGGDNPNRICGNCELHIDLRPLPGMPIDDLREELSDRLGKRLSNSNLTLEFIPLFDGIPAMETSAEAAIVKAAEAMTGYQAQAVAFGTEGPYFNAMGMESIIMGPGSIDQAHQPDEFLALDQIKPGVQILKDLINKFCF